MAYARWRESSRLGRRVSTLCRSGPCPRRALSAKPVAGRARSYKSEIALELHFLGAAIVLDHDLEAVADARQDGEDADVIGVFAGLHRRKIDVLPRAL